MPEHAPGSPAPSGAKSFNFNFTIDGSALALGVCSAASSPRGSLWHLLGVLATSSGPRLIWLWNPDGLPLSGTFGGRPGDSG